MSFRTTAEAHDERLNQAHDLAQTADPWRRAAVGFRGVVLRLENDQFVRCPQTAGDDAQTFKRACPGDHHADLCWTRDGDQLHLDGSLDGAPVAIGLKRIKDSEIPLLDRRFRRVFDD